MSSFLLVGNAWHANLGHVQAEEDSCRNPATRGRLITCGQGGAHYSQARYLPPLCTSLSRLTTGSWCGYLDSKLIDADAGRARAHLHITLASSSRTRCRRIGSGPKLLLIGLRKITEWTFDSCEHDVLETASMKLAGAMSDLSHTRHRSGDDGRVRLHMKKRCLSSNSNCNSQSFECASTYASLKRRNTGNRSGTQKSINLYMKKALSPSMAGKTKAMHNNRKKLF
jgi:hypothetical protein